MSRVNFKRGEIYYVHFPYTFDPIYPLGKKKFVVVLQEGAAFRGWNSIAVLLVTSNKDITNYDFCVTIDAGTTKLEKESYVVCAQPFTMCRASFEEEGVWCAGTLSDEKLDEIDVGLHMGLCMNLQNEREEF